MFLNATEAQAKLCRSTIVPLLREYLPGASAHSEEMLLLTHEVKSLGMYRFPFSVKFLARLTRCFVTNLIFHGLGTFINVVFGRRVVL